MRAAESDRPACEPATLSRREFLAVGAAAATLNVTTAAASAPTPPRDMTCIVLLLTGGPSQLETWDPKPDAPAEIRGPFGSMATSVPGIRIGEHLPRMAQSAHRWALIRSVHHTAAAIHETGMQLVQTGRLSRREPEHPHFGAVLSQRFGPRRPGVPPFVILPTLLGNTGLNVAHGQSAGVLGAAYDPVLMPAPRLAGPDRDRYGPSSFGAHCHQACRLTESGVRCVVVNMFDTLYDRVTWDCHADGRCLPSTLSDYRRILCPSFDWACSALLEDLHQRGLLDSTLVIAAGEFGRTPRLNAHGGRDHWPGVWSVLVAGGGVRGGQVIGESDKYASEPTRQPVRAEDVAATVYHAFGIPGDAHLTGPQGDWQTLPAGRPIDCLFR
jgi:uncharacterized protein (DUF1501 family)